MYFKSTFVLRHFWNVTQNEEFLELSADKLIELIGNDKLEVEKEENVFLAVKRWFNHKPEERSHSFQKVKRRDTSVNYKIQ